MRKNRFTVHIPGPVRKIVASIPLPWKNRIIAAMTALENDPFAGKPMIGSMIDRYKIRIWPYRIIYRVILRERLIVIVEAGHRGKMSY